MTLVERAFSQARAIVLDDNGLGGRAADAIISTDDAAIAMRFEGYVVARNVSAGDGPMVNVLCEALMSMPRDGYTHVITLQPTSPLRRAADINGAWEHWEYCQSENPCSLVSVNEDTGQRNGAIYITRVEMLRDGLVFDDDSLKYQMPASRSLDVNTPEDLEEARRILGP